MPKAGLLPYTASKPLQDRPSNRVCGFFFFLFFFWCVFFFFFLGCFWFLGLWVGGCFVGGGVEGRFASSERRAQRSPPDLSMWKLLSSRKEAGHTMRWVDWANSFAPQYPRSPPLYANISLPPLAGRCSDQFGPGVPLALFAWRWSPSSVIYGYILIGVMFPVNLPAIRSLFYPNIIQDRGLSNRVIRALWRPDSVPRPTSRGVPRTPSFREHKEVRDQVLPLADLP